MFVLIKILVNKQFVVDISIFFLFLYFDYYMQEGIHFLIRGTDSY